MKSILGRSTGKTAYKATLVFVGMVVGIGSSTAQVPFVNWENHPTRALALSPSGQMLAVAHTADGRVQLFDVSQGLPTPAGQIQVGLDPVAVNFRTDNELWVVNHVSDSVNVINVASRSIMATVQSSDEPSDVVFAGSPRYAFVSSSQTNSIQRFSVTDPTAAPVNITIDGEEPRALAVSNDGMIVYAAIFESGNATTIIPGALAFDIINSNDSPYARQNPPPNNGDSFDPPIGPDLPAPPRVGLIVRRDATGRWQDDNQGDWTEFVNGGQAARSGRFPGWNLLDHDVAAIDTRNLTVRYADGLMNIVMGLSVRPNDGQVTVIGTEANNVVRYEPNVNGTFASVEFASVNPTTLIGQRSDLNPHLDYSVRTVTQTQRDRSIGDPRSIVWNSAGTTGYVAGLGSNNVVVVDSNGRAVEIDPIEVGQGPAGLALSADDRFLYVWNHFEATLSTVDLESHQQIARTPAFNPTPAPVQRGRQHLYNTTSTSGLGHLSCATCHVDGRTDRLAWDLGDPTGEVKAFEQNCSTDLFARCLDFHPMKGPMLTQTLQDIIGKEPFHWRGDRDNIEQFDLNYTVLHGDDGGLTGSQMADLKTFLATITLPPNPYRELDNSLSTDVALNGHFSSARHGTPGRALPPGNAVEGLRLFDVGIKGSVPRFNAEVNCTNCHQFPTGHGDNATAFDSVNNITTGGRRIPLGEGGENHLGIFAVSTVQNRTFKVPQLRTLYERTGARFESGPSLSGFGFLHDGTFGSLAEFLTNPDFSLSSDQEVADAIAFLLSFSGSDLPPSSAPAPFNPQSMDSHAAVGKQVTMPGGDTGLLNQLEALARESRIALVAHQGSTRSSVFATNGFVSEDQASVDLTALLGLATSEQPITFTALPSELGQRFALDRDGDGVNDQAEFLQGSDPADNASNLFAPVPGLWYNPQRAGHGVDIELAGDTLAATWYTYNDDGTPVWYQAVNTLEGKFWTAELLKYRLVGPGNVNPEVVGTMSFDFADARQAQFCWTVDDRPGCEPFQQFVFAAGPATIDRTGLWFDPAEAGYGYSMDSQGNTRVVVVYYYDGNDEPRWLIGSGTNARSNDIELLSFTGFCPDCVDTTTSSVSGGAIELNFSLIDRTVISDLTASYPGTRDSLWNRAAVELIPLTDVPVNYSR